MYYFQISSGKIISKSEKIIQIAELGVDQKPVSFSVLEQDTIILVGSGGLCAQIYFKFSATTPSFLNAMYLQIAVCNHFNADKYLSENCDFEYPRYHSRDGCVDILCLSNNENNVDSRIIATSDTEKGSID